MDHFVTPEIRAMVGQSSKPRYAVDLVSESDIRRWVISTMDDSPFWYDQDVIAASRFTEGAAPGPFPMRSVGHWKRRLGERDLVRELDFEEDFRYGYEELDDPAVRIDWPEGVGAFHAGNEVEYFQFAQVGDRISVTDTLVGINEKQGKSGPIAIVHIDSTFTNQDGDVLIINHATNVARVMPAAAHA